MAYDNATETAPSSAPDRSGRSAAHWLDMIDEAKRCFQSYQDKCDTIDKLYADLEARSNPTADREFAIFWANLEVLKPTIYSRPPVPVVVPRFKDRKELPRKASEVLERCLVASFEIDDIDATMRLLRDDVAINARGVVWVRYVEDENGQHVRKEHVDRHDFLHDPARKWSEVEWVARRSWLTRKQAMARFGDIALKAEYSDHKTDKDGEYRGKKKCQVWELWHKGEDVVVWVSPGMEDVLDITPPFLKLEGFFPCPRPAYGTTKRRTLVPVPDFIFYKDQVEEINELTARISSLSESLRLKGFYPAGASDVADAIEAVLKDQSNTATLVPISSMAAFGGTGSLKDSVIWLPVRDVADVITALVQLRKQLIDDVYQITGISDIMRGTTEASETLGAQQLKSQYGSIRIRDRQNELVRIARDVTRIEAEIMAEEFAPETLARMSQVEDLPTDEMIGRQIAQITQQVQMAAADPRLQQMLAEDPQAQQQAQQMLQAAEAQVEQLQAQVTLEKVVALLREQHVRPFVLEIETDSTIQPDEDAQKQRASEFVTAVGGFMQQSVAAVQMVPQMAPLAAQMLQFVASQFRAGRTVDQAIDQFADEMKQLASQPKPPPPEQVKAEAEAKARQEEAEIERQKGEREAAADERRAQIEEQKGKVELQSKRLDLAIKRIDLAKAGMEGEADDEGNVTDKSDRMHGEVMDQVSKLVEAMGQFAQMQAEVNQQHAAAIQQLTEYVKAPVDLIRDPRTNRVVGGQKRIGLN